MTTEYITLLLNDDTLSFPSTSTSSTTNTDEYSPILQPTKSWNIPWSPGSSITTQQLSSIHGELSQVALTLRPMANSLLSRPTSHWIVLDHRGNYVALRYNEGNTMKKIVSEICNG